MVYLRTLSIMLLAVLLYAASPAESSAQVPRYVPPAGSPLPAELDYFRRDVGVMDPYNTFVAPRRRLNNQLNAISARQSTDFQAAKNEISSVRQSLAAPTGVSAGFMNYSHYYSRGPVNRAAPRR